MTKSTKKRDILAELREADERAQIMLDATPLSIHFWDKDINVLDCNREALEFFGMSDKQEMKDRFFDYCPCVLPDGSPAREKCRWLINKALEDGRYVFEWTFIMPDGENVPCEVTLVRVKYKGEYVVAGYSRDLRKENDAAEQVRRAEEEKDLMEETNRLKSTFLANMSHEIRTPMNAILGITEIELQKNDLPPETEKALGNIYESGSLLLNIINDILDFSKIEAGKLEIVPVKYSLPSLINDTVQLKRLRYENKLIEFKLDIDKDTPLNMLGDELRIKQILGNVLSNAFKYTDKGEVRLCVSADSSGEPATGSDELSDATLIFKVSDTGQGMNSEQLEKLFDDYTRFNAELNYSTSGTGLGMSITKRLVDLMGGEIDVKSRAGEGTVFTVRIPQKRINGVVCGAELSDKLMRHKYRNPNLTKVSRMIREYMPYGSVLVADDVESNIYVTRGMLQPYGLKIDTVHSGRAVIDKITGGNEYDIIFMDHMMPGMDGIEAAKVLREMGYAGCIIALTANALVGHADMFLKNGFDWYISKPIDSRELNDALNKFIRNKKPPEVVTAARSEQTARCIKKKMDVKKRRNSEMERLFVMDAESAIAGFRKVLADIIKTGTGEIDSFQTYAHGIKSALKLIGEVELSEFAYKLERAAKDGDIEIIAKETPTFITKLLRLMDKFSVSA